MRYAVDVRVTKIYHASVVAEDEDDAHTKIWEVALEDYDSDTVDERIVDMWPIGE